MTTAVTILHYALPGIILGYYVGASIISACFLRIVVLKSRDQGVRKDVIFWLSLVLVVTYVCTHAALSNFADNSSSHKLSMFSS